MIEIRNITRGQPNEARVALRTNWSSSAAAFPIRIDLAPGDFTVVPDKSVDDWDPGVKQWLAEYVANGLIKIYRLDSSHLYQDKGNNAAYGLDYLIDAKYDPLATTHALAIAASLHTVMNAHFANAAVHMLPVAGQITAAVPTDLATLIVWITDAQTEYNTTHRTDVGTHPTVDTVNTLAPVVPVSLATCISALRELHRAFHSHKEWYVSVGAGAEIDIATLLAY